MKHCSSSRKRSLCNTTLLVFAVMPLLVFLTFEATGQTVLIEEGDEWRFFKGTEEPPSVWNVLDFDDSSWETGPSGFGYGDNDDATMLSDMRDNYLSIYTRKSFEIEDLSQVRLMLMEIYDKCF